MAGSINVNQNNNNVDIQDQNGRLTITDNNAGTTINVTQPVSNIVTVSAIGPQGPVGPIPTSGAFTGSFSGSFTGSLQGTASNAVSASYALTASYVENAQTASYVENAQTASYVENAQTASYVLQAVSASYASNSTSASYAQTASYALNVNPSATASYAINALSASYAQTASYVQNAQTASYVQNAQTASYVLQAVSASFATSASQAQSSVSASYTLSSSYAISASQAQSSVSASFALNATNALTASYLNTLNQDLTFNGNLTLNGTASIANLVVNQIAYSSGSNQLGDAADDTQTLYGTVRIPTGSLTVTGSVNIIGKVSLSDGSGSVFIGSGSGILDDGTSNNNTGVGVASLQNNIVGTQNVAIGWNSLNRNTAGFNTAVGSQAMRFNTTGTSNTAVGAASQASSSLGSFNSSLGTNTLFNNFSGSQNTAVGSSALFSLTSGSFNSSFGVSSLFSTTSGSSNTALGVTALSSNITGSENIGIGRNAGRYYSTGTSALTDTSASIFIGFNSRANGIGETNQIVIGNEALGLGSNTVVLGNNNITRTALKGNVSVGTTGSISSILHVKGSGTTSATTALRVENTNASASLVVLDNGFVGINTGSAAYNLDVNGTARVIGQTTIAGAINASGGFVRGTFFNQTLVATANNDTLYGIDINPTYTTGSFTGVTRVPLRIRNASNTANAFYVDSGGNATLEASLGVGTVYGGTNINLSSGGGNLLLQTNYTANTGLTMFNSTRNIVLQNGGTFTDAGYRLDVSGSARITNGLLVTGGITGSFTGSVVAPGATTQIVYNNGGVLDANSGFVYSGSRVGIGAPDPAYPLEVNGAIYQTTGQILITSSGSVNKEGAFIAANPSARNFQIGISDNSVVPVGIDMFSTNNSFPSSYLNFRVNNADLVRMTGSFVGIGTTNPQSILGLGVSPTSASISLQNTSGTIIYSRYGVVQPGTNNDTFIGSVTNNSFIFNTANTERGRISNTGNFLLGTTSELARLQVRGSGATSATTALRVENTNASASLVVLDNGYVGIGNSNPVFPLQITSGSNTLSFDPTFARISSGDSNIQLFANSQNVFRGLDNWTNTWSDGAITTYFQTGRNAGNTAFSTYLGAQYSRVAFLTSRFQITNLSSGITPPTNYFQIDSNNINLFSIANSASIASVGINNISPSASLHISGASSAALLEIDSPSLNNILFVTGSGRVGIGTNTPVDTFHLVGSLRQTRASGILGRYDITSANANQVFGTWEFYTNTAVTPDFFGKFGFKFEGGTTDAFKQYQIHVADLTNPKLVVDGAGRVGIGTITPTASFHISGASSAALLRVDSPASSSILFVTGSGNVGINTANPTYNLEVSGSTYSRRIIVGNASGSSADNDFYHRATNGGVYFTIRDSNNNSRLYFTGQSGTSQMVAVSQNIGLGVYSPTSTNRVTIGGIGATSATTALRVENSNASASLTITDDRNSQFFGNVGIQRVATASLDVAGTTRISGSFNTAASGSILTVQGSGSAQPIFTVQGSQGELFSITDSLSGSLFSVNDISGLPILEVFSDNTTLIGNYQDPMLITTAKVVQTNSGSFTVYSLPTASYDTAFFEYSIRSGSNARAGTIMAMQLGSAVNFTETTTTDFGDTTPVSFTVIVTGSNMALTGSSTTGSWTIKTIVRGL